jgi:hypothetical protein
LEIKADMKLNLLMSAVQTEASASAAYMNFEQGSKYAAVVSYWYKASEEICFSIRSLFAVSLYCQNLRTMRPNDFLRNLMA